MDSETPPTPTPTQTKPTTYTIDVMVEKYILLRDKISEIKTRQSQELTKYTTVLETLGNWLLDELNTNHVNSMRTDAGTAYKDTRSSHKVTDWAQTLTYIQQHHAWDLLERRVNKTTAEQILEDTKTPIPGVTTTIETTIHVRKPTA
jgi:hypothetical protein